MNKTELQILFFKEIPRDQIVSGIDKCNALEIDNDDQLIAADGLIIKMRFYLKQIQTRKGILIKPYKDKIDEIKDFAAGIETRLDGASRQLTRKKSAYLKEKEKLTKKELLEKADDIDSILEDAKKIVPTYQISVKPIRKYKIPVIVDFDLKKVPNEYLILNESKIKKDWKAGKKIPGVRLKMEEREMGV